MTTWQRPALHPPSRRRPVPTGRHRGWARLGAGAIGLGVATTALWWSGRAIPGPSTFDGDGVTWWLGTSDPVVAAFALMRLAGLALAAWVTLSGTVALVVHLSRLRRIRWLRRLVDRLSLPVVRRLVHGAAGVALATATLVPGTAGALDSVSTSGASTPRDVAALVALAPATTPPSTPDPGRETERAIIVALPPANPPTTPSTEPPTTTTTVAAIAISPTTTTSLGPTAPTPPVGPPRPAAPSTRPTQPAQPAPTPPEWLAGDAPTWRIEPGQHLWHVAEAIVTARLGATPTDEEVAGYLGVLIAANRHRLVVPTNPDLVFAGQEFVVPPPTLLR